MQESRGLLDNEQLASLSTSDLPARQPHTTAALVEPTFFDLSYSINPHMGGEVDRALAREQWEQLREVYGRHAEDIRVFDPATVWETLGREGAPPEEQPDMVFVANHAIPTADGAELVLSRMATPERADEPRYFAAWARGEGYRVQSPPAARFEGAGDATWHPGRELLWGGYGVRSDRAAYDELVDRLGVPVVPLELTDDRYYHLDLCLLPLSETDVLVQPEAFTGRGLDRIEAVFETVIEAPVEETLGRFVVNGEVFDDAVITSEGAPETERRLEDAGYEVVPVETGEFRKAGGSVRCLTLRLGTPS